MTTVTYPIGYSNRRVTMEQMEAQPTIAKLDPETWRRGKALIIASNGQVGVGTAWRSAAVQDAEFHRRHDESPPAQCANSVSCKGKRYCLKPGMANAACSGLSYHEECPPNAQAFAFDFIGDLNFVHTHEAEYGLHTFGDVNDEPWHGQPPELPNSRRNYIPSKHWPLPKITLPGQHDPGDPQEPPQPPQETDMDIGICTLDVDGATSPAAVFIGPVTTGGLAPGRFWEVYWVNGDDPRELEMLEIHRANKAQEFRYGSHVTEGFLLKNTRLPSGKRRNPETGEMEDWSTDHFGATPYVPV